MDWTREITIQNFVDAEGRLFVMAYMDGKVLDIRFCGLVDEVIAEIS